MSAENIITAMLASATLDATFGDRRALVRLPADTDQTQKCLVCSVVYDEPTPNVNYADGKRRARARCRVSVTGKAVQDVLDGQAAVRGVLDFKFSVVHGGHTVLRIRKVSSGEMQKDDSLGVWWRPDDYDLIYFE